MNTQAITMNTQTIIFLGLAVTLSLETTLNQQAQAANLVRNGDFEGGYVEFDSDYDRVDSQAQSNYAIRKNPTELQKEWASFGDHTTGSGNMLLVNGSDNARRRVWFQDITVDANSTYDFSAFIASVFPESPAQLRFSVNSTVLGELTASATTGLWQQFSGSWNSGDATSARLEIVDLNTEYQGNDVAVDDIAFESRERRGVPEPTSLLSIALMGGWILLSRWGWKHNFPA